MLQRSLSSLELRGALSIANAASLQNLSNSVSSLGTRRPDGVGYDVSCSTSEYGGRHKNKVNDSAHDISLQVLEKFSLLTKFARDTTSHIFRESQNTGFNTYEKKENKDSFQLNDIPSLPNEAEAIPEEILEKLDTLEVNPFKCMSCILSKVIMIYDNQSAFFIFIFGTFLIMSSLKQNNCFPTLLTSGSWSLSS